MPTDKVAPDKEPAPTRAGALAEAAAKLPEVMADVDRLQAAWRVLMSPRTPNWKRILVALEVVRLSLAKRFRKAAPVQPDPAQEQAAPAENQGNA